MSESPPPDGLILNVSNRCNLRCVFCYEHGCRVDRQPSLETVREIVAEPRDEPPSVLMYMGAETFLRTDLEPLIRLGPEFGIPHVGIATNGTLLRKRAQIEPLLRAGLDHLELSIHSLDPGHAETLSGRAFTHQRQRRALELLHELAADYPLTVTINTVLMRLNLGDVLPLLETLEREYPRLAPMFHLKYPYSVAELDHRVEPASFEDLGNLGLVAKLPDTLRPRVVFEQVPLCALAPHYAQSCELVGVALDNTLEYYLTLPTLQRGSQGFALGRACEFARVCDDCTVKPLCPGLAPGYLDRLGDPGGCSPLDVTPGEVLRQVNDFRRAHGLALTLALDEPPVVEAVWARAEEALPWRIRAGTGDPGSAAPSSDPGDGRPFVEALEEYHRTYGALTPRVPELIALRAGLQAGVSLPLPDGDAGARRLAQARAFASRAGLTTQQVRGKGRRRVILRGASPSPDQRAPEALEAFGRPPVCCAAAAKQWRGRPLTDRLWELVASHTHASWLMNPFLWSTPFQLFRHVPCSLDCNATRDRASTLFEALGEHNPKLQRHVRRFRTASVFFTDLDGRAFLFDRECRGERIDYGAVYAGMGGVAPEPPALFTELSEALTAGNAVTLAGDTLTVRADHRLLARFLCPAPLRWKLLNFI